MLVCPQCDFENVPTASFCVNCGQRLARSPGSDRAPSPASEAERRFVTILFADLSGFTSLTETHDPEMVRELINTYFDRLVPVIERNQGVIDQFVGDAIMALFGAPIAHEDDPARACRAALEMMQAIEVVNAERGMNLGLHIGINSGLVLAGGVGSRGRQQYSVLGDAVNLAARLDDVAERGEIFVGEETVRLALDQFEFVALGAMRFKGKAEPQPVWQLIRALPQAPTHRRIQNLSPLFGRELELALLRRVANEYEENREGLRIVSILGEAGLGKSRLVQEWFEAEQHAAQNSPRGLPLRFLVAGSAPGDTLRAFALITEIARQLLDAEPMPGVPTALAELLGDTLSAENFEANTIHGSVLHAQYADALRALLDHTITDAGLVLVCEDLHWADAPSVEVLRRVLADKPKKGFVFCFTSRLDTDAAGWSLIEAAEDISGVSAVRVHLTPLSENESYSLLSALLPGTVSEAVPRMILAHAEGNPLFVEELVRMLVDRGDLRRENNRWVLAPERAGFNVPNTLQGILMARVDQLPPEARRILQIASVLGKEFPLDVLEQVVNSIPLAPKEQS